MKKILTLTALICVLVLCVAGCSRGGDGEAVPSDSVISQDSVTTESAPDDSHVAAAVESQAALVEETRNVATIYLVIPTETGLSAQEEDIILKGARRAGYDVVVKTHEGDEQKQKEAFDEAARAHAVAVICDNISGEGIYTDAANAKNAGIPVFLMNKGVAEDGVCDGQVRTNRNSAIAALAEIFARHHRLKGTYALLYNANDSTENLYMGSFRGAMESFSRMKEASEASLSDLTPENVKSVISSLVDSNSSIGTFVCGDSDQALAVIAAMAELGIEKEVICLDGDNDALTVNVREGSVYAAVVKPAQQLAQTILEACITYLQTGQGMAETAYVDGVVIANDEPDSLEDINREIAIEEAPTPTPVPSYDYDDYDYDDEDYDYNYDDYDYDDYDYDQDEDTYSDGDTSGGNDSGSDSDTGSTSDGGTDTGSDTGSGGETTDGGTGEEATGSFHVENSAA